MWEGRALQTQEEIRVSDSDKEQLLLAIVVLFAGLVVASVALTCLRIGPCSRTRCCSNDVVEELGSDGTIARAYEGNIAELESFYAPREFCADMSSTSLRDGVYYQLAPVVVLLPLFLLNVWLVVFYLDDGGVAVYRVSKIRSVAVYVAVALVLCSACAFVLRDPERDEQRQTTRLWLGLALVAAAFVLAMIAETTLEAHTYPGPTLWIVLKTSLTLLSGALWYSTLVLYAACALAEEYGTNVSKLTLRKERIANAARFRGDWPIGFGAILALFPFAYPLTVPGPALWILVAVVFFTPIRDCRLTANLFAALVALVGVVVAVWRIVDARDALA